MDALITAAAHALASGDPLGALQRVALRNDAPALALRGTAMAQLGDLVRARALLRQATRAYGQQEALARARCLVAETEIALASRDLGWSSKSLSAAHATLEAHGDHVNAAHARFLAIRRLLLIGRLETAERTLEGIEHASLPPPLRTARELIVASIAVRRLHAHTARTAFARAAHAARQAGIPALITEVEVASQVLTAPAARLIKRGTEHSVRLEEVEVLLSADALVIDACRFSVREGGAAIVLAGRPVLFTLARLLAESWPADATRETLIRRAFRARLVDDSHRVRLRVEVGRLRRLIRASADIVATRRGFAIVPRRAPEIVLLAPPVEDPHAALLALLADGESWSSSALALARGASVRTVQRALESLAHDGKVQRVGRGRAQRWLKPPWRGFTTTLLLPPLPFEPLG